MPPPEPLAQAALALAHSFQKWITASEEARGLALALAKWLEQASRGESAAGPGGRAAGILPPPGEVSSSPSANDNGGHAAAANGTPGPIALTPKKILGPRIVAPPSEALDPADAVRALATGLGMGGISPRSTPAQTGPVPVAGTAIDISMDLIARRCRLKGEACAFARDRNARGFDATKDTYDRLRADANTVQPCYLWGIQRDTEWLDDAQLETAQGCYANLAAAAELAEIAPDDPTTLELLAEAQGGVYLLLQGIEQARGDDREQRTVYAWLRGRIDRGEIPARILDAARDVDPVAWRGLESRLAAARERLDFTRKNDRARRQSLKTLSYHAGRIADAAEGDDSADLAHDWHKVQDAATAFLDAGGQPSDPDLVRTLAPLADRVPEAMLEVEALSRIMPYLDERLSEEDREGEGDASQARRVTDELLKARELLRGKTVVLIGGKCRHQSKRLIERELELKELRWLSSEPHSSIAPFETEIARPDVAAVLMMIRWSSHSFEGAKEYCVKHEKPWVRVPAGYNPSQLAHQIMQQQGERLAEV